MDSISDKVREMMSPGNKVRLYISEDNIYNGLLHILAVVDDCQIVYKVWSRHRRAWSYRVDYIYKFELFNRDGWLTLA